jgi:hypothetical protein
MKRKISWRIGLAQFLLGSAIIFALFLGARTRAQGPGGNPSHLPSDWSHRHMVFSRPDSFWRAWELQKEPRYWHQWTRQNGWALRSANAALWNHDRDRDHDGDRDRDDDDGDVDTPRRAKNPAHRDWSELMLAGGTVGAGMYPAKFTFDVNATPSCANDFIAFNTSLAGVSPTTAASQTGTFTGAAIPGETVTIGNPTFGTTIVLTASLLSNTGLNFQTSALVGTQAANLRDAITRNGASVGVTAASAAGVVTVTATTNGTGGNLITLAKTVTLFTWAGATLAGGAGTANIVAFNQLYASQPPVVGDFCNPTLPRPAVYWSYFTGTGTAVTSIVLSFDGTKVAFVENVAGTATLRLLKWKSGEGAGAGYPVAVDQDISGANWSTCTAGNSCIASIAFNGGVAATDTKSPPFYNYATDELYVGNDNGILHKFTGVFLGTPAEVTTGGWPLTVNLTATLTGPIFDSISKNIFVADSTGRLSFVREVGSVVGTAPLCTAPCLDATNRPLTGSIVDSPIVDGSAGRVLVFDGTETSGNDGSVFQFDTALTAGSKVTVRIGGNQGATPTAVDVLHAGTFDDAYFSTGPATGHLYTCGKDPGFNNRPAIYRLSFNAAGVLQVPPPLPLPYLANLTNTFSLIGDACSPVTELKNGATDRIFFGFATNANPPAGGTATGCTAGQGCVASIVLGGAWPPAATTAGVAVPFFLPGVQTGSGGTSGIVVDNVGVGAQESSIYYTFQTNSTAAVPCNGTVGVGCAVKVTQSALQ